MCVNQANDRKEIRLNNQKYDLGILDDNEEQRANNPTVRSKNLSGKPEVLNQS